MSDSDWEESEDTVVVVPPSSSVGQRPPWRPSGGFGGQSNDGVRTFVRGGGAGGARGRAPGPGRGFGLGFRNDDSERSGSWRQNDSLRITVDTHDVGRIIGEMFCCGWLLLS